MSWEPRSESRHGRGKHQLITHSSGLSLNLWRYFTGHNKWPVVQLLNPRHALFISGSGDRLYSTEIPPSGKYSDGMRADTSLFRSLVSVSLALFADT
jgi:hypothetical protein